MNRITKLVVSFLFLVFGALGFLYVYELVTVNNIHRKAEQSCLRIGYINLHQSQVTLKDIRRLQSYNCDVWLFLEWNGDNFQAYPQFCKSYSKYFKEDKNTLGFLICSKFKGFKAKEVDNKTYLCNYGKQVMRFEGNLELYLVHAPPPVPSCGYQTKEYLDDLLSVLKKSATSNRSILIGDFNSFSFQSQIKEIVNDGYLDSYGFLSKWPMPTFNYFTFLPKIVQLDYVFHKGKIRPVYAGSFSISSSDHNGFIVDYEL